MTNDKSTTITLEWAKVGPAIGLIVFIGGLVTTSVNAAVSVAQYKARIEANDRKIEEQQARIARLEEKITRLEASQDLIERLQGRIAALEGPRLTTPAMDVQDLRTYPRNSPVRRESYAGDPARETAVP